MDSSELERKLKSAEARAAELQAWVDDSEAESEKLRARITELEGTSATFVGTSASLVAPAGDAELARLHAKVAELQSWADAADAENEKLRAQLSAAPPAGERGDASAAELARLNAKLAELQSWADAADAENEQLRAQLTSAPSSSPSSAGDEVSRLRATVAELQSWADAADAENEKLRAQLSPSSPAAGRADASAAELVRLHAKVAELQSWADAADAENEQLRAQLNSSPTSPSSSTEEVSRLRARVAELQSWADAADLDNEKLRARVTSAPASSPSSSGDEVSRLRAKVAELQGWADDADSENETLRGKVAELEATKNKLQHMASSFAERLGSVAHENVKALEARLSTAQSPEHVTELEALLANAREAIATLEVERSAALDQVRRYVQSDGVTATKNQRAAEEARREFEERDRHLASLEAQLAEKVDEVSVLHVRVKAHAVQEQKLQDEAGLQRQRACVAEEKLGQGQAELDVLRQDKATLEARALELGRKLDEIQRWRAGEELQSAQLTRELEAARTELAVIRGNAESAAAKAQQTTPPPPPADALAEGDDLEGFSVQRLHRLEALLAAEQLKSDGLGRLVATIEKSVKGLSDEVEVAHGKLADLKKKLGWSDAETGEALDRLDAARRELHALKAELGRPHDESTPPEPPAEADVLEAPMEELSELAEQQAQVAKEATDALAGEQRARDQLVGDLTWLKTELEKLSHVRDELRQRIQAMVQRELRRKTTVGALLEKLRSTEVAAAARAGSLRRLQLAMELAQKNAVKVQTMYFQKQIGSLQRQLETALKPKRRALELAR
jgi:chromosome segregation ATPase